MKKYKTGPKIPKFMTSKGIIKIRYYTYHVIIHLTETPLLATISRSSIKQVEIEAADVVSLTILVFEYIHKTYYDGHDD